MSNANLPQFYVSFMTGGSKNFVSKACVSRYKKREDATAELTEVRAMGYPAMIAVEGIGGFESFDSPVFRSIGDAENYYKESAKNYSIK